MARTGRPREYDDRKVITVRLDRQVHERLADVADDRGVSVNFLVCRALEEFLPRLLPVREIRWTRDDPA